MKDQLSQIEKKILQLKEKKESLQTKLAISFMKEAQNILGEDKFTPELALTVLSHSWNDSSLKQKEEWQRAPLPFPQSSKRARKTALKNSRANS